MIELPCKRGIKVEVTDNDPSGHFFIEQYCQYECGRGHTCGVFYDWFTRNHRPLSR